MTEITGTGEQESTPEVRRGINEAIDALFDSGNPRVNNTQQMYYPKREEAPSEVADLGNSPTISIDRAEVVIPHSQQAYFIERRITPDGETRRTLIPMDIVRSAQGMNAVAKDKATVEYALNKPRGPLGKQAEPRKVVIETERGPGLSKGSALMWWGGDDARVHQATTPLPAEWAEAFLQDLTDPAARLFSSARDRLVRTDHERGELQVRPNHLIRRIGRVMKSVWQGH